MVLNILTSYPVRHFQATDFKAQLEQMKEDGLVDPGVIAGDRVPRELKRSLLMFLHKLGEGAFGEVWKGLLKDGDNTSVPEYLVAAKTVKVDECKEVEGTVVAERELMQEALLMAQVEPHTNLVSIVGVITRGRPKTLVRACVFDHETTLIVIFSTTFERVAPSTPASATFTISTFTGQRELKLIAA